MTQTPWMEAVGLHAAFHGREVLRGIDLPMRRGELLGILGANGAGKTTLLRMLTGLHMPSQGQIRFADAALQDMAQRARKLAYLEQNTQCHWPLEVEKLVELGRLPHKGFSRQMDAQDVAAMEKAMAEADVLHLRHRPVTELSTGEQARVFLARALAVEPEMLLVDEPVAGLDPAHQLTVMELLAAKAQDGLGVVAVLHDLPLAVRYCTQVVLLHEGRVLSYGTPEQALADAHVQKALQVRVLRGEQGGVPYILPWTSL